MTPTTKRRKRRRAKARLKNEKSVRKHKKKTGRTGGVWKKKVHGKDSKYVYAYPNAPILIRIEWNLLG